MARKLSAFLLAALVAAGLASAFTPAARALARAPICSDLVDIVAFRGSGEDQNEADGKSDEWLGPRLKAIIDEGRNLVTSDGVNLAHAPVFGVPLPDYPAIKLSDYFDVNPLHFRMEPATMLDSAGKGAVAAQEHMANARRDCPGRRFVLIGYSQGATAARIALRYVPEAWIAGAFLIGDPELRPDTAYAKGSGGDDSGGSLITAYRAMGINPDTLLPDQLAGRPFPTYSYCHEHDIVCDARFGSGAGEHGNYGDDVAERRALAGVVIDMYRKAKQNSPPTQTKPVLDVMFAIDTTGSMTPYIDNARASAENIAKQLSDTSSSFQVGLVEYRDHGDEFVSRTVTPLTADAAAFRTGLDTLVASGGGDTPEAVFSGMLAAAGAAWRTDARRIVIVIGDAPAHDPEPVTGYTKEDVVRAFNAAPGTLKPASFTPAVITPARFAPSTGPIRLYGLAADDTLATQLSVVAKETGGVVLPIDSPTEVAAKIAESLTDATAAPSITLGLPVAYAGKPVALTALDVNSTVGLTYEWDLNGDGTVDKTTTTAELSHTYDKPGTYTVKVRVHDAQDRQSSASGSITVLAPREAVTVPLSGGSPSPSAPATSASASAGSATPTPAPATTGVALPANPRELGRTGSPIMLIALFGAALVLSGAALLVLLRRRRARLSVD